MLAKRTALLALAAGLLCLAPLKAAAPKKYRVVFDVSVSSPKAWTVALRNIANLRRALGAGNTEVEVVAYSRGLPFVLAVDKRFRGDIDLLAGQGVSFLACSNSLKEQKHTAKDLIPVARVVDSGVAELVRRQTEGWAYIKVIGDAS